MKQRVIALIDCDSFYVSCERKDNPSLQGKAVCVMTSASDKGIVVSRSKEAKELGVKMGAPYFQIKNTYKNVVYLPTRMKRYAEISAQVMSEIKNFSPDVEVVSVDEAYIDLTGLDKVFKISYVQIIKNIRQTILEKLNMPVSIGLSSSKILAKLASDKAKSSGGIFVIPPDDIINIIGSEKIDQVSGVGRKNAQNLYFHGVFDIKDFVQKDNAWIRAVLGINGLALKQELMGIATSLVDKTPQAPQSIQDTKSFEDFTDNFEFLSYELNYHIHNACKKIRQWNGFCSEIEVMLKTKDFKVFALSGKFENPTNSNFEIRALAQQLLKNIYNPNFIYRSTGITLKQLTYGKQIQQSLFDNIKPHDDKLSHIIDELEYKFGQGIVKTGKM